MYKVERCKVKPGKVIAEIILFEDQSQPLPSPFFLDGVTDT